MLQQTYKNIVLVVLVSIFLLGNNPISANDQPDKKAIQNLIAGIQSDNAGLKCSSIYFSGFYKIEPAVDALVKQIDEEECVNTRLLIIRTLYNIGDSKGMDKIKEISFNDKNFKVRSIAAAVYEVYLLNNTPLQERTVVQN